LAERLNFLGQVFRARAAAGSAFRDIALVEPPQIFVQPLIGGANELFQRVARKIAILVVDRLDPGSVHGQQLASEKVEPPAKQHELTEHGPEGRPVVAPKVGDGLEVGLQAPEQPDHLDVAVALHLQPTARPHPVQIAVDVELQQIGWRIAGAARRLRRDPHKPRR
jgi:hypothetical protein